MSVTHRSWPTRLLLLLVLASIGEVCAIHPALAWWNNDWSYRVKIDADTTSKGANITAPIGHMQVLLRLYAGNFNFATAKEDGSDLRVVAADDRTPLHFQIEKFDGLVDQIGLIWVDVPKLASGAVTSFYVYWGDKNAVDGSDGKATFSGDDLLVYHFADQNGPPRDSTAYGNTASNAGKRVDGGMIGDGLRLDGSSLIQLPPSPSLTLPAGQPTTYSMWVHPDSATSSSVLYSRADGANAFAIGLDGGMPYVQVTTAAGMQRSSAGAKLAPGWHLIDVTASDQVTIYIDGQKSSLLTAALPPMAGAASLGGAVASVAPVASPTAPAPAPGAIASPTAPDPTATPAAANFVGIIDEFRIVHAVVPDGAMRAQVASEGPTPHLLTLETPQQSSIFGNGFLGIILKSVTPDAWVVIGILGVMSLISWVVMIGKGIYVSRVTGANVRFRRAYRDEVSATNGDLLGVMRRMHGQTASPWRGSTLFRLNDVAAGEIDERLSGGRMEADGMLSARSIAAIRSALDAQMAIEVQRLNRMMVLLTIAIAGGPFIGLLGTVIGVMITFAAIAQAGDVNVNAIAPGISAALLATVAGLAVAIPALFGYNYFNSRITDVISDMNVHIDTLVTRMGEGLLGNRTQAGE
jgi:biopolymer transport protein ExbB